MNKFRSLNSTEIDALQLYVIDLGGTTKASKKLGVTTGAVYNWKHRRTKKVTWENWVIISDGVKKFMSQAIDREPPESEIDNGEPVFISPERQRIIDIMSVPINPIATQGYWMEKEKQPLRLKSSMAGRLI